MPRIEGIKQLNAKLRKLETDSRRQDDGMVYVGFTQNYAVYVHENKEARHAVGQAKFLSEPARTMANELFRIVKSVKKSTGSVRKGLLVAGLRLQREAQLKTPVDTGALKASAFTAYAEQARSEAIQAYHKSEQIRKRARSKR